MWFFLCCANCTVQNTTVRNLCVQVKDRRLVFFLFSFSFVFGVPRRVLGGCVMMPRPYYIRHSFYLVGFTFRPHFPYLLLCAVYVQRTLWRCNNNLSVSPNVSPVKVFAVWLFQPVSQAAAQSEAALHEKIYIFSQCMYSTVYVAKLYRHTQRERGRSVYWSFSLHFNTITPAGH